MGRRDGRDGHNLRYTVELRYNGAASNGNPPITETILQTLGQFFSIFYVGNNKNPPVEDDNGGPLKFVKTGVN